MFIKSLFFAAALAAIGFSAFGFDQPAYDATYTTNGITYAQRGGLGVKDFVVTNIDASAVGKVKSVNGRVGDVVLDAAAVNALPDDKDELVSNDNFKEAVVTNALTVATTNRVAALESSKADKSALTAHTENTDNPHGVTAGQIGALSMSPYPDSDQTFNWSSPSGGGVRLFGYNYGTGIGLGLWSGGGSLVNYHDGTEDWYHLPTGKSGTLAIVDDISATNPTFSNAVLAVGLNIDTNSVAVLNEISATFGGFPIEGTATTVGGLLAALAAAAAWLKKNKVGSFDSVGGATATVENGVAKLDDFFTNSNSLLTGTIDEEVISKGTAPDAHLEAPTDEHLKLVLADNSVAYDSAKALPYKLTSVIGDRVIATMTLTAASTDITLPTIAANDTTVKDFILDVTNAYAVEGVATDAGINIPRTDFKLVTRDGESLTDVTTVKAGKSAFLCFTQKSPVVVDGTTYPCWCVIQLPFGDPS